MAHQFDVIIERDEEGYLPASRERETQFYCEREDHIKCRFKRVRFSRKLQNPAKSLL